VGEPAISATGPARAAVLASPPAPVRSPAGSTDASRARRAPGGGTAVADDLRPVAAAPQAPAWELELVRTPAPPTTELPLFVKAVSASVAGRRGFDAGPDEPLVRVPVEPRPPLSVRRPAPDPLAHRSAPPSLPSAPRKLGPLDRDLLEDLQRIELAELSARARAQLHASLGDRVGAGTRLAAAALDALVIGGVSATVLWITLRWCDLPFEQASTLPLLPMGAFLILVCLGYLLMFTAAGGQTIGKMAFGLRVVSDTAAPEFPAVTLSQAAYRVVLSLPSVLALGAGFVPALVGTERAFHDRLAHTRVVRA
jgi:uncharacterized RDD family membrane protein YckC